MPFPELTDREREVLELMARGHDNMVIARQPIGPVKPMASMAASTTSARWSKEKSQVDGSGISVLPKPG